MTASTVGLDISLNSPSIVVRHADGRIVGYYWRQLVRDPERIEVPPFTIHRLPFEKNKWSKVRPLHSACGRTLAIYIC